LGICLIDIFEDYFETKEICMFHSPIRVFLVVILILIPLHSPNKNPNPYFLPNLKIKKEKRKGERGKE